MEKQPVKIVFKTLEEQINNHWKMDALMEHYGLNHNQMKKVLAQTGLKIKRSPRNPQFIIEGMVENNTQQQESTETENRNVTTQTEVTLTDNGIEKPFSITEEETVDHVNDEPVASDEGIARQKSFWEQ